MCTTLTDYRTEQTYKQATIWIFFKHRLCGSGFSLFAWMVIKLYYSIAWGNYTFGDFYDTSRKKGKSKAKVIVFHENCGTLFIISAPHTCFWHASLQLVRCVIITCQYSPVTINEYFCEVHYFRLLFDIYCQMFILTSGKHLVTQIVWPQGTRGNDVLTSFNAITGWFPHSNI